MYYIYKDERLIGSSSSIDYIIEFTKLMVDKAIGTEFTNLVVDKAIGIENDSSRLKQLYEDKLTVNSPKVGINQLQHILARLEYSLEVDI